VHAVGIETKCSPFQVGQGTSGFRRLNGALSAVFWGFRPAVGQRHPWAAPVRPPVERGCSGLAPTDSVTATSNGDGFGDGFGDAPCRGVAVTSRCVPAATGVGVALVKAWISARLQRRFPTSTPPPRKHRRAAPGPGRSLLRHYVSHCLVPRSDASRRLACMVVASRPAGSHNDRTSSSEPSPSDGHTARIAAVSRHRATEARTVFVRIDAGIGFLQAWCGVVPLAITQPPGTRRSARARPRRAGQPRPRLSRCHAEPRSVRPGLPRGRQRG